MQWAWPVILLSNSTRWNSQAPFSVAQTTSLIMKILIVSPPKTFQYRFREMNAPLLSFCLHPTIQYFPTLIRRWSSSFRSHQCMRSRVSHKILIMAMDILPIFSNLIRESIPTSKEYFNNKKTIVVNQTKLGLLLGKNHMNQLF